jgi:hypothetical protein
MADAADQGDLPGKNPCHRNHLRRCARGGNYRLFTIAFRRDDLDCFTGNPGGMRSQPAPPPAGGALFGTGGCSSSTAGGSRREYRKFTLENSDSLLTCSY